MMLPTATRVPRRIDRSQVVLLGLMVLGFFAIALSLAGGWGA
jgi:hypothetical protein